MQLLAIKNIKNFGIILQVLNQTKNQSSQITITPEKILIEAIDNSISLKANNINIRNNKTLLTAEKIILQYKKNFSLTTEHCIINANSYKINFNGINCNILATNAVNINSKQLLFD